MSQSAFGHFSRDGRQLAFLRMRGALGQLCVANLTADMRLSGTPKQIIPGEMDAQFPAWTADGKEIVFMLGFASSNGSLARVRVNGGGVVRKIPGLGYTAGPIDIARKGAMMAFSRGRHRLRHLAVRHQGSGAAAEMDRVYALRCCWRILARRKEDRIFFQPLGTAGDMGLRRRWGQRLPVNAFRRANHGYGSLVAGRTMDRLRRASPRQPGCLRDRRGRIRPAAADGPARRKRTEEPPRNVAARLVVRWKVDLFLK